MLATSHQFQHQDYLISYRRAKSEQPTGQTTKHLLMLHGAGVAGELTWLHISRKLTQWHNIVMPDLRGMGKSVPTEGKEQRYTVEDVVSDMLALVDHLNITTLDLVGYSFGGLIAMEIKRQRPNLVNKLFLIEPALLERADLCLSKEIRKNYSKAAVKMRDPDHQLDGVRFFLNEVSPVRKRHEKTQKVMEQRLLSRVFGFSYALDAVTTHMNKIDREALLKSLEKVDSVVGGLSKQAMHDYHQSLEKRFPKWQYHSVSGTDHSLPYQKPRTISDMLNHWGQ